MFRTAVHKPIRINPQFQSHQHLSQTPSALARFTEKIYTIKHDTNLHSNLIALQTEENNNLFNWAKSQLNLASQQSLSISCIPSRQAAKAGTLISALLESCCYLKKYNPGTIGDTLLNCIEPQHRLMLINSFRASFESADSQSKLNLISAIDDGVLKKIGIYSDPLLQQQATNKKSSAVTKKYLDESELLALIDYVNSSTGIFNIVSTAGRAKSYYGIDFFQRVIQIYVETLNSALDKLYSNIDFNKHDIAIFKGIHLGRLEGRFNRAHLENAYHQGSLIAFPHPISGTIEANESYANTKYDQGYQHELTLTIPIGANVDPFHDTQTRGQKEIISPAGLCFTVYEKYQREVALARTGGIGLIEGYKLMYVKNDEGIK